MECKNEVRKFSRNLLTRTRDTEPFSDDTSLILSSRLQSVDAVELAVFMEEKFGVNFAEIDFNAEMIDSINAMSALIKASR